MGDFQLNSLLVNTKKYVLQKKLSSLLVKLFGRLRKNTVSKNMSITDLENKFCFVSRGG